MSTKAVSWFSLLVVLLLTGLVTLQTLEYMYYSGSYPQSASVWPPASK